MGEATPEVWAEELRRTGRVVFPQRRIRTLWRLAFLPAVSLVGGVNLVRSIFAEDPGPIALIFGPVYALLLLTFVGYNLWQLITGRPVVVVDTTGVRTGRRAKNALAWTEIAGIGPVTGPKISRSVSVIPKNTSAETLTVPQDTMKDVPAFAAWLTEVLAEAHDRQQSDAPS